MAEIFSLNRGFLTPAAACFESHTEKQFEGDVSQTCNADGDDGEEEKLHGVELFDDENVFLQDIAPVFIGAEKFEGN